MNKKIEIKQLKSDEDRTNAMDNHSFEMYRDEKGTNLYLLDYSGCGVVEIRNEDQLKDLFSVLLYDDESTVAWIGNIFNDDVDIFALEDVIEYLDDKPYENINLGIMDSILVRKI